MFISMPVIIIPYSRKFFSRGPISQIGHLESFRGLIFEVAQDLRHTHIIIDMLKFRGHTSTAIRENSEN